MVGSVMEKNSRGKKTRGRRRAGRSFEFLSGCQGSPSDMWTKVWRRWEGELWQYLGIRRGKSKNRSYEVGICRVCWKNSQNARMRRGWAGGVVCITVQEVKRTCRTSHITIWTNLIFFFFKAMPQGIQDLSSPTRNWTCPLCSGSMEFQSLGRQESPCKN